MKLAIPFGLGFALALATRSALAKTTMKNYLPTLGKLSFVLGLAGACACNEINAAGVFPIATNPGVEAALSLAFDGTNYLVAIMGGEITDTNRYSNVTAQLVSPTGALVGPRIEVGRLGDIPAVAFDGTNYLLIWKDSTEDIYGQRVSRSGALMDGAFAISTAPGEQKPKTFPPVAFGGGNYLVVWEDGRSGTSAVYGQLVSSSGALVGSEIAIDANPLGAHGGSVGFDGTKFLVIWQKRGNAPQEQHDTYGVFITPTGTKGTPFMISQTSSASYNPLQLLFNGTNYLAIWNKDVGPGYPSPSDFDIYGRFVTPAGSLPGNEMALVTGTGDQVMPGLAFDGANYLLNWTDGPFGSTNTVVKLQFFSLAGQANGPPFAPFAALGMNDPFFAEALFDGTRFAVIATFADGDVYGTFIPKSTAPPRLAVAGPFADAQFPILLTGTPGINYTVQASTNLGLGNWVALVTNSPANGTFNFTDTRAMNASRFYRAVIAIK